MSLIILLFVPFVLVSVVLLLVLILHLQRKQTTPSVNQTQQRRPDGYVNPLFRRRGDAAGTMGAAGMATGAGLGLAALLDQGSQTPDSGADGGSPDGSMDSDSSSFDGGSSSFGD